MRNNCLHRTRVFREMLVLTLDQSRVNRKKKCLHRRIRESLEMPILDPDWNKMFPKRGKSRVSRNEKKLLAQNSCVSRNTNFDLRLIQNIPEARKIAYTDEFVSL